MRFSEDQLAFRDAMQAFLDEACPPSAVRAAWEQRPTGLWPQLAELGLLAVELPEPAGLGLGPGDMVLLWEASGHAALPVPFLEATVLAPLLPAELGERVGTGEARVGLGARAWDADLCEAVVIGDRLHRRFETTTRTSVDGSRRLFDVHPLDPGEPIADPSPRAALAASAQLLGLGRRMLELTVDYAKVRRQFGKPIGSFQAVQHHLCDALLHLEFAAPLVYEAARTLDPVHVAMAKAAATEASHLAGRKALQCHGAIGYCVEHDLHLFLKRAWALQRSHGGAAQHLETVATHLFGAA